jgi:hypothetical protein
VRIGFRGIVGDEGSDRIPDSGKVVVPQRHELMAARESCARLAGAGELERGFRLVPTGLPILRCSHCQSRLAKLLQRAEHVCLTILVVDVTKQVAIATISETDANLTDDQSRSSRAT